MRVIAKTYNSQSLEDYFPSVMMVVDTIIIFTGSFTKFITASII